MQVMTEADPCRPRHTARLGLAALALTVAIALTVATGDAPASTASCSGALQGTAFSFSCDATIGGNSRGWLFVFSSSRVASAAVSSPAGVSCESRGSRTLCSGPTIPAGKTVSGSFTLRQGAEEEEGSEEGCAGGFGSVAVLAYGPEDSPEFEEEEGPTPLSIGRFALSSCPTEEGGRGTSTATLTFGKVRLKKEKGTAVLPVTVSAPGSLVMTGKGVVKVTKSVKRAGKVQLLVKAKGKSMKKLVRTGKVTVTSNVTLTPSDGNPISKTKKITLRLI